MGTITQRYKDKKIKHITDTGTGEVIDTSELGLLQRTNTGEISINSKAFVYLDTDKLLTLLANGITQVELAMLITISSNLLIGSNICMKNDNDPHTTESIAKLISKTTTTQSVKGKLKKLEKLGVLYYGMMKENKRLGKVYIVNPHIIRRGVKLKGSLALMFDDIKKKY
jgi:hypothetical protein